MVLGSPSSCEDVEKLRAAPQLADNLDKIKIGGYVYDVHTGEISTVVASAEHLVSTPSALAGHQ